MVSDEKPIFAIEKSAKGNKIGGLFVLYTSYLYLILQGYYLTLCSLAHRNFATFRHRWKQSNSRCLRDVSMSLVCPLGYTKLYIHIGVGFCVARSDFDGQCDLGGLLSPAQVPPKTNRAVSCDLIQPILFPSAGSIPPRHPPTPPSGGWGLGRGVIRK